jgi:hypothetical protein
VLVCQALGASREIAPGWFAITELLLLRTCSVQRSLTVRQVRMSLAGLVEEPLPLLLRLLEMLRDLDAGRPLPRKGKVQLFGLPPGFGLMASELAGLGEFGGDGAQAPGQRFEIPIPAKLFQCHGVGTMRLYWVICHQLRGCKRYGVLSPVLIGIRQPLPRLAPRAIHLVELSPALRHTARNGANGELASFEQALRFGLATKHLPVCAGTAMELVEAALEVCEAGAGALMIFPAAEQRCPAPIPNLLSRLALIHGNPCIGFD